MAKAIIGDKLYDTEKSEEVITYIEGDLYSIIPWKKIEKTLYVSLKGNWFTVTKRSHFGKPYITKMVREEVADILERLNEIELYKKHFGLEEA